MLGMSYCYAELFSFIEILLLDMPLRDGHSCPFFSSIISLWFFAVELCCGDNSVIVFLGPYGIVVVATLYVYHRHNRV